jgi:hypothetical protein
MLREWATGQGIHAAVLICSATLWQVLSTFSLETKRVDFTYVALTGHVGSELSKMLQRGNDSYCF